MQQSVNIFAVQIEDILFLVLPTKGFDRVGNPEIEMIKGAPGEIFSSTELPEYRASCFNLFKAEKLTLGGSRDPDLVNLIAS